MNFFNPFPRNLVDFETNEGEFVTHDNQPFHYKSWLPKDPKFLVLYLHGAASHSEEASNLAKDITDIDGATFAFDQRGWGRSSTRSAGHINSAEEVIEDVVSFLHFIQTKHPELPVVLVGHSMGGLIAARTLLDHQDEFTSAVLCSPWIGTRVKIPFYVKLLGGILSKIWPTFSDDLQLNIDELTHDNDIINQYHIDLDMGLRKSHGTVRWFQEMMSVQETVKKNAHYITIPTLVMQAGQDLIVSEGASKDFYTSLGSEKKDWQYYPQLYHELFNEVKKDRKAVIKEASSFINSVIKQI